MLSVDQRTCVEGVQVHFVFRRVIGLTKGKRYVLDYGQHFSELLAC